MPADKEEDRRAPSAAVVIRDFLGYVPNADPHDLPAGAAVSQINATSSTPGQLTVRLGMKRVKFDS